MMMERLLYMIIVVMPWLCMQDHCQALNYIIVNCANQTWNRKDVHINVSCEINYSLIKDRCEFSDCIVTKNDTEEKVNCYPSRNEQQMAILIMEIPSTILKEKLNEDYPFVVHSSCAAPISSTFSIEITGTETDTHRYGLTSGQSASKAPTLWASFGTSMLVVIVVAIVFLKHKGQRVCSGLPKLRMQTSLDVESDNGHLSLSQEARHPNTPQVSSDSKPLSVDQAPRDYNISHNSCY